MRPGYCPNCKTAKNMRMSVYNSEKITKNGDIMNIKTTSFHCETCNLFIDSEDVIVDGVRRAIFDRRTKPDSGDGKHTYLGPERRSGKERRIWIDRIKEVVSKISKRKNTK